jgi:hypothetical protein
LGEPYALARMMHSFVDSVVRGHSQPDVDPTFEAGLAAQRAQDSVLRSAAKREWQTV